MPVRGNDHDIIREVSGINSKSLIPRIERTFMDAHIIILDAEEPMYGGKLADTLVALGFHRPIVVSSFEKLLETGRMISAEVVFLNPHGNERSLEAQLKLLGDSLTRRKFQTVILCDSPQHDETQRRIDKFSALDEDKLRRLMVSMAAEWERGQFKRYD